MCEPATSTSGGDITSVAAGAGLTGGGASGDVTLAANLTQLQARVAASCPANESIRVIAQNGTVLCEPDSDSGGDITSVVAGTGLTGGAAAGVATLSVSFGGTGAINSAARSDHTHAVGVDNTVVGSSALVSNTPGWLNTAVGRAALLYLDGPDVNSSSRNTAIGNNTLESLTAGQYNTALGAFAGAALEMGDDNIYLGNNGIANESQTIRIGSASHTRAFMAAVRGVTTARNDAVAVVVDTLGQLGTVSSSRRTKFDIADLEQPVTDALQRLRPVQFRYRQAFSDGTTPLQYGLIAEEVQEVLPELVALDGTGQPATVKYHVLPSLLLADVQRLERERIAQDQTLQRQREEMGALREELSALRAAVDRLTAIRR
ncbi:MAG: tail fiber domain-containing protein [Acidobacteria bacterium]|nr:tail fiber domain-containing protein [Acidobacteriota bacterium]